MIELSDYTFLNRLVNELFSIGFAAFFLYAYFKQKETNIDPRISSIDYSIRAPSLDAQLQPLNKEVTVNFFLPAVLKQYLHDHRVVALRSGYAAMFTLFLFDVVGTALKYTEGFSLINTTVYFTKPIINYSISSRQGVVFADFLINLFWSFKSIMSVFFVIWWRTTFTTYSIHDAKQDAIVGTVAVLQIPVFLLLQIIFEAASLRNAWLPVQVIASIGAILEFGYLFKMHHRNKFEGTLVYEKDVVFGDNIKWLLWAMTIDVFSLVLLTIGALVGTNETYVYFQSKFFTDYLTCMWSVGFPLGFLLMSFLMYHEIIASGETTDRVKVQQLNVAGDRSSNINQATI